MAQFKLQGNLSASDCNQVVLGPILPSYIRDPFAEKPDLLICENLRRLGAWSER
jgi:hypothetical protein